MCDLDVGWVLFGCGRMLVGHGRRWLRTARRSGIAMMVVMTIAWSLRRTEIRWRYGTLNLSIEQHQIVQRVLVLWMIRVKNGGSYARVEKHGKRSHVAESEGIT